MKIAVDFGHGTGQDRGASGYLNEEKVIREYGPLVIAGLKKLGHTVYNVTPTMAGLTLNQSLAYRVNAANASKVDLFLCLHVNAFATDKAQGCEVEYISASGKVYGDKICTEISKLGFINRGSQSRPNLYVLKYTNAVAVLVEPFFCDTKSDCAKYNATKLANAIIKGITGHDVSTTTAATKTIIAAPKYDETIPLNASIFKISETKGYIDQVADGSLMIHLDRGNYISVGKGFVDINWNDNNGKAGSKRISS